MNEVSQPGGPFFSVITPSFNQAAFIEQTIASVLQQKDQAFEHIVIDGGSKDGTVEILKKFPHLSWVSEPDRGQAHALNKGLARAAGKIIAWINSDDWYEPGAFSAVANFFNEHPDAKIVMGDCNLVDERGNKTGHIVNAARGFNELKKYWKGKSIPTQPALFFWRELIEECGPADESLFYAMDYDLWMRFARKHRFHRLERTLANYRFHPKAKGGDGNWDKFKPEWRKVHDRYASKFDLGRLIYG